MKLREEVDPLLIESLRAAEMRQGCTNHSYYAELLRKQLFSLIAKRIKEIKNPYPGNYISPVKKEYFAFNEALQAVLNLLEAK